MTQVTGTTISPAQLYAAIAEAWERDPELECQLLNDLPGTVASQFGVVLPKPASLARTESWLTLHYDGQAYALGNPRQAANGELNDAELELVAGGNGCPPMPGSLPGSSIAPTLLPIGQEFRQLFTGW